MKVGERLGLCREVRVHPGGQEDPLATAGEVNPTACEQWEQMGLDGSMRSRDAQVRNYAGFPETHWGTLSRAPEREGGISPCTCRPGPAEH